MVYQLVILGPEKTDKGHEIVEKVAEFFKHIGIDYGLNGEALASDYDRINWTGTPVAIWLGGDGPSDAADIEVANNFLKEGAPIFPIVDSLAVFSKKIPENLHYINGQEFDPTANAACIVRAYRLARKQRQAFISYKRSDSTAVAIQLFHSLTDRGYNVFLDTASVEAGVDFQNALWSRMADVDLVVFIDTKDALTSTYVHQEINRAHDLGLGIVQVIWPDNSPTIGTELCVRCHLLNSDFESNDHSKNGTIKSTALKAIMELVESQRIKSIGYRRLRMIDLINEITMGGMKIINRTPLGNIDVINNDAKIAEIIPVMGTPDAPVIHYHEINKKFNKTILAFNGLGVDPEWMTHIEWLNSKSNITTISIDDLGSCLKA